MLIKAHVDAGHDVLVAASTESFDESGNLTYVESASYMGGEGAKVVRLPYRSFISSFIARKIRSYKGLYELLNEFSPDVILFHGLTSFDLLVVSAYAKKYPHVTLYADSHEDFNNSARGIISRLFLYKLFYKPILDFSKKYIKKIFYITLETKDFCMQVFSLDETLLEFLPLGGVIPDDEEYSKYRKEFRYKHGVVEEEIVFCQTGKFDANKNFSIQYEHLKPYQTLILNFLSAGYSTLRIVMSCSS